jgi:hypothetical protein
MPARLLLCLVLLASLSWGETFDKPIRQQRVDLGPSPYLLSGWHAHVTCYFFPKFMVKEVDMGEKGAERLGIVPVTPQSTRKCTRARSKEEKVVSNEEWGGYFMGVKGGYVFLSGEDGWNGAEEFAIFDAGTGKKLFEDAAQPFRSLATRKADISFVTKADQTIVMQYVRVVDDDCLILKDPGCWPRMAKKYGLDPAIAPDCRKGSQTSAEYMAQERCYRANGPPLSACMNKERPLALQQALDEALVLSYPVEVELSEKPSIKPTGPAASCWRAD